jgi:hypothetical protein
MDYKIVYQICRFPQNNSKGRYSVRKLIFSKTTLVKCEYYQYGERNLNKLNKEITKMKYQYQYIDNLNFDDINIPKCESS